jgi:hypothetical protein
MEVKMVLIIGLLKIHGVQIGEKMGIFESEEEKIHVLLVNILVIQYRSFFFHFFLKNFLFYKINKLKNKIKYKYSKLSLLIEQVKFLGLRIFLIG